MEALTIVPCTMAHPYDIYSGEELKIAEKIQQRRYQMLVHSYIYYNMNENIVSDSKWSAWAVELAELQNKYPDIAARIDFAKDFEGWDGSSGAFFEYKNKPNIVTTAERLLEMHKGKPATLFAPAKQKATPLFAPKQSKPVVSKSSVPKKKLF